MAQTAATLFERVKAGENTIFVSDAVVAQVVFILSSRRHYRLPRIDVVARLTPMLQLHGCRLTRKRVVLGALGLAAAASVPLIITRSGSRALPIWREAASPGPLSAAHAFLGAQCEACHTAYRGITVASCLTCHATDEAVLAQQSTAFHATIGDCWGCHIEHRGTAVRPTEMDHAMLARIGWQQTLVAGPESAHHAAVSAHGWCRPTRNS